MSSRNNSVKIQRNRNINKESNNILSLLTGYKFLLALVTTFIAASMIFVSGFAYSSASSNELKSNSKTELFDSIKSSTLKMMANGGSRSSFASDLQSSPFTIGTCDTAGPIEIESTGGTTTPTAYATLTAAFAAINAGTHTDTINIEVCGNTDEGTGTALLNASGAGSASYTTISIKPVGGSARTIMGATTAGSPMIDFSGADNVTIDGLNTGGNSLTISNTTVSATTITSTIRFIGGATNNTITNSNLQGSVSSSVATNGAVIFFSTDAVTANGNDNNTISNNNIGPAGANLPTKAILGNGSTTTTAIGNSGIIIDNNNIFDFFGAAVTSSGIATNGGCNNWTITNNKFYQTGARTWTTGAAHIPINITPSTATSGAQGFTITGNIIGYASNTQTGTYTLTGSTGIFRGIVYNGITGGTVTNINNNTIASVSLTGVTTSGTGTGSPFMGMLLTNGLVNSNNNTIGSQSATGSLTFSTTTTSSTDAYGIYNFSLDNWTSNNNNIGGISVTNAGASGTFLVFGMRANTSTALSWTATSNNVGGTVANSVQLNATGTSSQVIGMQTSNAQGLLTSNQVRNLTTNIGTGTTTGASMIGINVTTTTPSHTLSQNTISSLTNTNATGASVVTGLQFTGGTANVVERNLIYGITAATNSTAAEVNGIRVAGGTTVYRNNMIAVGAGIDNAIGTGSTTGGVNGINEPLGTDSFFHNSVYVGGSPTAGVGPSYAFNSSQVTNTRSFRNNIFFNARNNSGATGKNYIVRAGGTTSNPTGLTINNNVYFANGSGAVFGFFNSLDVADLAAWRTAVGQDSGSINGNPQYNDATNATPDLHLHPTNATVAEGNGADVGVLNDFDGQTRASLTPVDIGADAGNFNGVDLAAPSITYTAVGNTSSTSNRVLNVTITDNTAVATGGLAPRVYFNKNAGSYFSTQCSMTGGTVQNGTWACTIDYTLVGGVVVNDIIRYFVIAQDTLGNIGSNPGGVVATDVNNVTMPPAVPNQYTIVPAITGSINVGTGQTFTSLTNTGGAFEAINNAEVTGNVTLNITTDLTGELGTVALNEFASPFTVLIKPSGGPRSITGSSTNSIIRLSGADNVTINGSTSMMVSPEAVGGNPALRELTVTNTNTTATAGAVIAVMSGTNGAQNNTIKNVNIVGQDPTQTLIGLHMGGNTVGSAGTDNDNNRVENCSIQKAFIGLYNTGASAANQNTGNVVTMNDLSATGTNRLRRAGMLFFNHDGLQVTMNSIGGITSDESLDGYGIGLGIQDATTTTTTSGAITNSVITKNKINGIASTSTVGFSAFGIGIAGGTTGPNTISNNMISGVIAPSTSPDLVAGIFVAGVTSSSTRLYHNSVSITGDRGAVASQIGSYGVAITGTNPVVELKNNIFYNTQISGGGANAKSYSIGMVTTTFTNLNSNFNDFFTSGANSGGWRRGGLGATATDDTTLAAWQTATSQDAGSQEVDPMFVSASDLHLLTGSPMINTGTTGTGITDDIDEQMRDAMPDIGADERVAGSLQFSSASYSVGEGGGMVTLTVTRTGGSDGAVNVNYSLGGGNATGGAACGGAVDYVNMGGTLMFANGETMKTFDVTICEDAVFEGNETFDAMLSNATGGATIGTPGTATVTITDNEVGMPGTVQFAQAFYTVGEGDGSVTLTVTRTGGSDGAISVEYAFLPGTANGAATCGAGIDFAVVSGTLNWANGDSASKTINVTICEDSDIEGNENFLSFVQNPTGGATIGTQSSTDVTITDNDVVGGPVTVTATAGTASGTYNNLTEAVAAINNGTHQGDIVVNINQTITEPGTVVINSSGAGTALYTSILIRPTADGISDSGPSAQGRGLIELNGADNVTIDGDNPNTMGINRNLTLQNTAANTTTFTSVVRIALATTVVNSADNNTIKNLNVVGSATGRNISTATSTTASENTTFGIFAGPGGSTVSGTTAPSAVTSVSTSIGAGATANNLLINNNSIVTAARGVSMNGSATSVFPGLQITKNRIGNQMAGDADQVYSIGITAQGSLDGLIADNTVWVEGFIPSSAATHGINVGVNSATGTFTIERNMVNRVRNSNPATWSAFGINLGGGSNHVVQNNFISGVINSQVAGTGGFGTTFGAYGIRIASGTGHKVYHNSVHLYDALAGTVSTDLTAAFLMSATTQTGVDVRNNIFVNRIVGGNPTGTRNVAVYLPSGATSAMNLTFNNNAYYVGTDALNLLAKAGATFGALEFQAADFDPTSTTPAANFRSYTSTLSAAGTNDNASFASTAPPPFTSNVNLHIPAGTATRLESGGAMVGVTTDIDLEMRNASTPDIGADEFAGMPPFANDIAAVSLVIPVNGAVIPVGQTFSPQARFTNNGTATQTNVTVRYQILDGMMTVIYNQTVNISTIAPLQNAVVTFPSTSLLSGGTYTIRATSELSGDQDITNDTISGTVTAVPPITGTVTVGTGGTYTSLTNAGGLFQALNTAGISGNVTVNIISDLTGETGAVPLNQIASQFAESGGASTLTIKPSGAARTISGTSAASSGLIILHGADNVIIDGSLSGGTDRSLTITNNQATTGVVIWMRSPGVGNGATNNTIKNCIINGAPGPNSTTVAGILTGSSVTLGNAAEAPNSNNTIQNNWIYRVQNSLYLRGGALAADFDRNWLITGNELGSTAANDKNIFRGMLIGSAENFFVIGNIIHGIQSTGTTTAAMSGIQIAFLVNIGTIANNVISDIKNVSTTGTGAFGMQIGATSTNSNVTILNNFIYDIATTGLATVNSNSHGLMFNGSGTGYNVYFNSINMNTNQGTGTTSSAMNVNSTFATAGALNVRNNIFANTQTTGTRYAVYSTAAAGVFSAINYNDYFAQNVGFIGGSARATLSDWQTATGQDTNSIAVNPLFVSATDLHIQLTSPMFNAGVNGTGVTTDIDGNPRDATPDIGADELFNSAGILSLSSSTYTVGETAGTVSITVNRTGTMGAVTVDYTMTDGTAIGGAACGGNVDYVNTGGTVMFADGQASKMFVVTICPDSLNKMNETFNLTLSNPTGGAIVGGISTAVVTIIDDDPQPSISITDVSLNEGNSGTTNFTFNVNLSAPSGQTVTVHYQTADGTATVADNDYTPITDTVLTFNPGQTSLPVTVLVNGDTNVEPSETFFVNLSSAMNATISDNQGVGTIINDDFLPGTLTINDVKITEGNTGTSTATFTVTLVGGPPMVSVLYQTANGTAMSGSDYIFTSGTLNFDNPPSTEGGPPTRTRTLNVTINGDTVNEANETFFVNLNTPTGATITDGQGVGIIIDDDRAVVSDFDHDRKSDISVFRPTNGTWYTLQSTNNIPTIVQFGVNGDKVVPGDYDGDGITDRAVWRPTEGIWYIFNSSNSTFQTRTWGLNGDIPVQGDYNGDGKTDLALFRPSDGIWYILQSPSGPAFWYQFGISTDVPVQGDYDGDAKTDLAVFRNGVWYILRSSDNLISVQNWGVSTDKVVSGDFDGDGRIDLAIFRDGVWWIRESLSGNFRTVGWGLTGDIPVAADYDGDGTSDIAVFRPSDGIWYILRSSDNSFTSSQWGQVNDIPVPSAYIPQ